MLHIILSQLGCDGTTHNSAWDGCFGIPIFHSVPLQSRSKHNEDGGRGREDIVDRFRLYKMLVYSVAEPGNNRFGAVSLPLFITQYLLTFSYFCFLEFTT